MKKLLMIAAFALLCGCSAARDTHTEDNIPRDTDTLRREYHEYFGLGTFKGIEVYVWQDSPDTYQCGAMSGTNRNKTDEEIWSLFPRGISPDEMKLILSTYDADDSDIIVIPVIQPASSYAYTIDDEYRERVSAMFE